MKRISVLLFLIFSFGVCVQAQTTRISQVHGTGAPSTCNPGEIYTDDATGNLYGYKTGIGCVLSGNTATGAGTVTSVSVVSANGLSGTVANPTTTPAITLNISGLDAAKIGDGSVSTAEFQFINSVSSNVQTQIDGKAPTTPTYVTQTPDATLSAEQALSTLPTGPLANTTTTGVLRGGTAVDQSIPVFCSDAGSTDAYACSLSPTPTLVTGTHYRFKANTANTGAATINFSSLGAVTIVKVAGGVTTALADNDIRANQWVDVIYDGTNFQMQSTLGNAATSTVAAGADTQVQYNDGGTAFGANSGFIYNKTTKLATITPSADLGAGLVVASPTGGGQIWIQAGSNAIRPGYISWFSDAGITRLGYMGYTTFNVQLNLENNANFSLAGGHFTFANDNTNDIGASGATRPRTGYFGTSVVVPTVNAATSYQVGGVVIYSGGTPSIAGNGTLNTGSKDSAGKITATGTGASTIVLTFSITFTRAPACMITNETTANLVRPISTTTGLTVAATIVTGDSLSYVCTGY